MKRSTFAPIAVCLLSLGLGACGGSNDNGDGDGDGDGDSFDRRALLSNVSTNVIVPTLAALETETAALGTAVDAYCSAIDGADEATELASAQDAWRQVMVSAQLAEVMRLGPAAADDNKLRDELYSWPLSSSCAVDQEVKDYFDAPGSYDISGRLTNRRGLDALEYVLFSTSLEHTCDVPVAPPGWDALTDLERKQARCGYAQAAAADVAVTAAEIHRGWLPAGGDFLRDFSTAGVNGSSFPSAQAALNVLSDAMFFVEFEVKDIKLGESSGITENSCGVIGEACVEELESQFAHSTKEHVVANLRAFDRLFRGDDGVGFDDMLIELGAPELAQTMTSDIAAMLTAAEAIPGAMNEALISDYESVSAVHVAVKVVTDNLKSQFLTVTGLDIPDNSAGDND